MARTLDERVVTIDRGFGAAEFVREPRKVCQSNVVRSMHFLMECEQIHCFFEARLLY